MSHGASVVAQAFPVLVVRLCRATSMTTKTSSILVFNAHINEVRSARSGCLYIKGYILSNLVMSVSQNIVQVFL